MINKKTNTKIEMSLANIMLSLLFVILSLPILNCLFCFILFFLSQFLFQIFKNCANNILYMNIFNY